MELTALVVIPTTMLCTITLMISARNSQFHTGRRRPRREDRGQRKRRKKPIMSLRNRRRRVCDLVGTPFATHRSLPLYVEDRSKIPHFRGLCEIKRGLRFTILVFGLNAQAPRFGTPSEAARPHRRPEHLASPAIAPRDPHHDTRELDYA